MIFIENLTRKILRNRENQTQVKPRIVFKKTGNHAESGESWAGRVKNEHTDNHANQLNERLSKLQSKVAAQGAQIKVLTSNNAELLSTFNKLS